MKKLLALLAALPFGGCLGMPKNIKPVTGFELNRYLGKWYEIARLDHSFERGMEQVTAEYSLREDGGVAVRNRGFLMAKQEWKEAEGKAFFIEEPGTGYLKVSFFGPFYGSYVIFELDKENSFVSGPDHSYLWFLARTPTVEPELLARFVAQAKQLGFDTSKLIYVKQQIDLNSKIGKQVSQEGDRQ